jgi:hypothetical protein
VCLGGGGGGGGGGGVSNSKQECFVFYHLILLFCLMRDLESCVRVSAALFAK